MYRKDSESWIKHWDFIVLDLLCLQLAYVLAYATSGYGFNPYESLLYRNMAIFLALEDLIIVIFFGTMRDVLKLGYYRDFVVSVKHGLVVGGLAVLFLFILQEGENFSRLTIFLTTIYYIILSYGVREFWKARLRGKMRDGDDRSLLVVTTRDNAEEVLASLRENNYARYRIAGLALMDGDRIGEVIDDVLVVADGESAPIYVCQQWIDEVLVVVPSDLGYPRDLLKKLAETGVTVHYNLPDIYVIPGQNQFVESIGDFTVMTNSLNYASTFQLFMKRAMDIVLGAIGCIGTGIIFIFAAPAIYKASPGPIFFKQERVGKNGKRFTMYKFRTMYMDAEERKAELMDQNKLADGKMFKMDFDPRVIGNEVLPDGTQKTGLGDFLRRNSLDEFPQFFNVLKGDMSVVGTRPPLVSETNMYDLHHRARLAIKPGITGLWQVSGRSNITDFEEVVELDREYIQNWSIGQDMRILLKTCVVVLRHEGSI